MKKHKTLFIVGLALVVVAVAIRAVSAGHATINQATLG